MTALDIVVITSIMLVCLYFVEAFLWRRPPTPVALERTAAHESGHALTAWIAPCVTEFRYVTIVPDADSNGCTLYMVKKSGTISQMMDVVIISLAGFAAEIELYGSARSGGCAGDLITAYNGACKLVSVHGTEAARRQWGSAILEGEKLDIARVFRSPPDPDVLVAFNAGYGEALRLIRKNRASLDCIRRALIEKGTLTHDDLEKMFGPRP